jgi:hypothetical protein
VIRSSLTDWRPMKKKCRHARHSYACPRWIFIFDSDQAQINSVV